MIPVLILNYLSEKSNFLYSDANRLEWHKIGNYNAIKRFKIHGKRLKIENYTPKLDSGVYVCIAIKESLVANASLYLGDFGRLSIKISKLPLEMGDEDDIAGKLIELTCQVMPVTSGTQLKILSNVVDFVDCI